jgi:hypothetical protein
MLPTTCRIYDDRPKICKCFPTHALEILDFDECTFYFEDGVRKGECCGCGQCCIGMPWPEPFGDSKKQDCYKNGVVISTGYIDDVCRHLVT